MIDKERDSQPIYIYLPCFVREMYSIGKLLNYQFKKIIKIRKAVSKTEHPAIRQISVLSPALLVVVLFMYWVVWILMKWIV